MLRTIIRRIMDKEFVTYEQALALKELGFKEDVLAWYDTENKLLNTGSLWQLFKNDDDVVLAPLKQQVFRWFRDKYADLLVKDYGLIPHFTMISNMFLDSNKIWTYEEAELECLKKLIEIVKQK